MKFITQQTPTKLRGGYYTPRAVAVFLAKWVLQGQPCSILEPSCGDGAFFSALSDVQQQSLDHIVGFEIDKAEANKAAAKVAQVQSSRSEVYSKDFLLWSLTSGSSACFDGVLGNPPFVRYQYLSSLQQELAQKVFRRASLAFTKHTNAWVPFVVSSIGHLREGGRLAMVIPSEILHVPHAQSLRDYLGTQCSRVLVIDPLDIWMDDVLQGIVLLLAEKKKEDTTACHSLSVVSAPTKEILGQDPDRVFRNAVSVQTSTLEGKKWMPALLTPTERGLLEDATNRKGIVRFKDVASVDVGIVTGANDFFLVSDSVVKQYDLTQWSHPMFGRSAHARGVLFTEADFAENQARGWPTQFLWFKDCNPGSLPPGLREYIAVGEQQGLHLRYKCKVRTPWYEVPSVYPARVGLLKRCHNFPRLILNEMSVLTTDTCYRVVPKKIEAGEIVANFVNSLTALSAELEGRHYGGGVLELVPSEIERLLIPTSAAPLEQLLALDSHIRSSLSVEELFEHQDRVLLSKIGFTAQERETLFSAYVRLRERRQRVPVSSASDSSDDLQVE